MLGTFVNTMAIIGGSLVGLIFSRFIPTKITDTLIHAVAFAVLLIGLKMAWKTDAFIIVICSLSFGTIIGELIRIEDRVNNLGNWLEERFAKTGSSISKGFVTTSLLYCVGSMAIVGANGSGKSTLLKLIALIDRPTRGQLFVDGRNVGRLKPREVPKHRRQIGVGQNFNSR